MESSHIPLPADLRFRRLVLLAAFFGVLWGFRHLAPVLICFVILERALGWAASQLESRAKMGRKASVATVLAVHVAATAGLVYFGATRAIPAVRAVRAGGREYLDSIVSHPTVVHLRHMTGTEGEALTEQIKHHAMSAVHAATATAQLAMYLFIGFLLAVIYLFERAEIDAWLAGLAPRSASGTIARWLGYVADAIAITVRLQVIVAIVSALMTLPLLVALRLPNVGLLFVLVLVTGLLPVVGNVISGAILCLVAYLARGAWAVGVFLGVTFVLHKVESYYLNPRLAAQHVKLPGLVMVVTLLLFEHVFGFAGLFLSFPALYVASRIAHEWRTETDKAKPVAAAAAATDGGPAAGPKPDGREMPTVREGLRALAHGEAETVREGGKRALLDDEAPEKPSEAVPSTIGSPGAS